MRRTNKIIIAVILVAVMLLGIGYAAIQNITLNITGTVTADPSDANFIVKFSETTSVSDADKVTASVTNDTNATINVTGLTAKGEVVTATYTVQNISADLSADLSVETTNSNEEYFVIDSKLVKTSLTAGEATTLTVTVELIKTPIAGDETSTVGVQLTAVAVQPGEEGTTGGSTGGSTEDDPTEDEPIEDENITSSGTYLPTGFSEVAAATSTTGLTIADGAENEYVWIEVPKNATVYDEIGTDLDLDSLTGTELTTALSNIETELQEYVADYRSASYSDTWYSSAQHGIASSDDYNELKYTMLKSVYENGGFYIGKYETGTATARTASGDALTTAVIQQNAYPYNFVTNAQAQSIASGMASGEYTSSLMFGIQWELVMKYLETKGATQEELNKDSTSWGNYKDNLWNITNTSAKYAAASEYAWAEGAYGEKAESLAVVLSTGASDTFSKQGIYDLAGNVAEWTLERATGSQYSCTTRGGSYSTNSWDAKSNLRNSYDPTSSMRSCRFPCCDLLVALSPRCY